MKTATPKPQRTIQIRYPLSKGLLDAVGMLKDKLPNALAYQRKIRREWGKRATVLKRS